MPDVMVFCQAIGAASGAGALAALVAGRLARRDRRLLELAWLAAFVGGVVAGFAVLQTRPAWPPAGGLDRFLAIVLPSVVAIEALVLLARLPPWSAWLLRFGLTMAMGRVLLHGSVYLSDDDGLWTRWHTWAMLVACGGLLALVWSLMAVLQRRGPRYTAIVVALALSMAILTGGLAVMLAGYIKGGAAALPLAAALASVALAAGLTRQESSLRAIVAVAIVALFCLLFIGVFFGRLSAGRALVILIAPLAVWIVQRPPLRKQGAWIAAALGLLLVATPLAVVLLLAKHDFDRKLAPLLGDRPNNLRSTSGLIDKTTT